MRNFVCGSSVISFREESCTVIASDVQLSYGRFAKHKGEKIFKFNDTLVAFSGDYSDTQEVIKFVRLEEEREEFPLTTSSYFKMIQRFLYSKRSRLEPLNVECVIGGKDFLGCVNPLGNFFDSDVVCTGMGAYLATSYLRASREEPLVKIRSAMELMAKRDCRGSNEIQVAVIDRDGIRFDRITLDINWDIGRNNEIVYT